MRNVTKRKMAVAVPALMAAGFSAWMGAPAAKGDFVVSVTQPNPDPAGNSFVGNGVMGQNGVTYVDYVVSALNLGGGSVPTASTLLLIDVTVTTPGSGTSGALYVSDYSSVSGSGKSKHTTVEYNPTDQDGDPNLLGFAQAYDGTFGGIAPGPLANPYDNNNSPSLYPQSTATQTFDHVFVNGGDDNSYGPSTTGNAPPGIDANYTAGSVHSLEVVTNFLNGNAIPDTAAPVPFFNVVIPVGTVVTINAQLSGDNGTEVPYNVYINTTPPSSGPTISLTGAQVGPNLIGPVLIAGGNGKYVPVTVPVTGASQTVGSLEVGGFNPNADEEIYGLAVTDTSSETLAQIAADLQAAVSPTNGTVETVASLTAGPLKTLLGSVNPADNLVAIFPTGSSPAAATNFFSYNLSNYNGSVAITSITVVPEPTGIGALVLGGIGLLSRRKARRVA